MSSPTLEAVYHFGAPEHVISKPCPPSGCRLRKMSDQEDHACSRCLDAGVPCVALDSKTKNIAPRSIVQYLETEIANLERHNSVVRPTVSGSGSNRLANGGLPPAETKILSSAAPTASLVDLVVRDFTPPFLGLSEQVPLVRCAVAQSRLPSTRLFGPTDIDEHHPRSIIHPLPSGTPLHSIPIKVADFLFDNYMTRVLPQYPIFYTADVVSFFNSVFHTSRQGIDPGASATPYEIYVVSLIMAISLSTAARTQQARANSIAAGLFKNAMQQIPAVLTNNLEGLQALLLLFQYTFLDPSAANLWFLSGFTSQACIDLGLHHELPESANASFLERDMRRRIFWSAYEMEVAVCAALLRPSSILSKHVTVSLPTEMEDSAISATGVDPGGRRSKLAPRRIWRFRQIECEIVSVLFQNGSLPPECPSLEAWMTTTEAAIQEWNEEVHRSTAMNTDPVLNSQWEEMSLYADIAYFYILVTLFRPCPRIKEPTNENLMKAFVAGVKTADGYWRQANLDFGSSKYVFHPCHHSFSGAVAFLQALQRCKETISISYTLDEVEGFMSCFSRLFATMAERWPAASRCLEEYERLLAPVKREYIDFIMQQARNMSQQPSDIASLVGFQEHLMDSPVDLDDMFSFGSLFQPSGALGSDDGTRSYGSYYAVPADWNAEFDFGMS